MSVISRRNFQLARPARLPGHAVLPGQMSQGDSERALAMALLQDGAVAPHAILSALGEIGRGGRLIDVLMSRQLVRPERLYAALSVLTGLGQADLRAQAPDPRLIDRLGAQFCLTHSILPWRDSGGIVVIATAHPEAFGQHYAHLINTFGPVAQVLAPSDWIATSVRACRGKHLARAAETRLSLAESCRNFAPSGMVTWLVLGLILTLGLCFLPQTLTVLLLWVALTLAASATVKLAALVRSAPPTGAAPENPVVVARLPVVSIMVALYKESDIAARLVRRLSRLDYPRELLDILLVVEEDDRLTRAALSRADLPGWIRIVVAPRGRVKTKPRALNFALSQCRGSIVGVYDAEDAPEADQIRKVVARFYQRGPEVACLQGRLDFYNPNHNWIARCFTIEYAAWFRVMLPGMQALGMPLPLGGTTLFFRRDVLEKLGGWDAHNVTEDADLGMRLARHGYRTEMVDTTTYEEANCVALPWVKQRSRWVKGYMMTYLTHMRDPLLLGRQLGLRGFLSFQVLFLGSLSQALLAPLSWSMLALQFGFDHPVAGVLDHGVIMGLALLFAASEALNIAVGVTGLRRSGQDMSMAWVPTLTLYFPLLALAAYKALWEVLRCPFYWDKTSHGAYSGQETGGKAG